MGVYVTLARRVALVTYTPHDRSHFPCHCDMRTWTQSLAAATRFELKHLSGPPYLEGYSMYPFALAVAFPVLLIYYLRFRILKLRQANKARKRAILTELKVSDGQNKKLVGFFHPYW